MQFRYTDTVFLDKTEYTNTLTRLTKYLAHLDMVLSSNNYEHEEGSINLPNDETILQSIMEIKEKKISSRLKYIIDIGIGGSYLGTKAIYDAVYGHFDLISPERLPKIIFVDTNDPEYLQVLVTFLNQHINDPEEILVNIISKSGTTTETIVNTEIILNAINILPNFIDRVVITTDFQSKLWTIAEEKNITLLEVPKKVGGRFSVFSAVGLFPLSACGINVEALLQGARNMLHLCTTKDLLNNPAAVSAAVLYLHNKLGKNINDTFFFHPELESLGKWYRQLMGESIGKEFDTNGNKVHAGITPTVSIGSLELHSLAQLYLGGPSDKVTTFVSTSSENSNILIPTELYLPGLVENITGKKPADIMKAILEGVRIAYAKRAIPFMEIVLDNISEQSLGEFLQFKMIEMMYLAQLLEVNAFDQPNVEEYKVETKKILSL